MKFLEIVGNASTSAILNKKYIGHNVNACAYTDNGEIVLKLESNGVAVRGINFKRFSLDEYENWKEENKARPLFVRGIELFDAEVMLR